MRKNKNKSEYAIVQQTKYPYETISGLIIERDPEGFIIEMEQYGSYTSTYLFNDEWEVLNVTGVYK